MERIPSAPGAGNRARRKKRLPLLSCGAHDAIRFPPTLADESMDQALALLEGAPRVCASIH